MPEIHNQSPVDLRPMPSVMVNSSQEIRDAVVRARFVQKEWEELGFERRAKLLKKAGRQMLKRRTEVLQLLHEEAGKTPGEMLLSEAAGPLQYIQDWTKVARPWLKSRKLKINPLAFPRKSGRIDMVPRGVVGIIAPWNYPLGNYFKPVFAALLSGNSVVIKPSEYSPRTAIWFAGILNQFLPADVVILVQGDRAAGEALIQSGIDALTFTGSSASGREVAKMAAQYLIPVSLELGGKDAAIVLADCDFDRTVAGVMHWGLHNAGQACGDIERLYVEDAPGTDFANRFIQRLVECVSVLRVKSGETEDADVGPTVTRAQLSIIEEHVADALSKGAKLLCGGKRVGKGLWFEPTVIDGCDGTMKIMQEPTFGPVIPIQRVSSGIEAVRLANQCDYGLNGSIWSRDIKRASRLARELNVGTAFVNNHAFTGAIPAAPWTGVKKSGYGVANSEFALGHYTRPRTVVIDRKRSADGWWLPMNTTAEDLGQALCEAQIGNLKAALSIPRLMARRQKQVMNFVKSSGHDRGAESVRSLSLPRGDRHFLWSRLLSKVGKALIPPLADFELRWGQSAVETIFTGTTGNQIPLLAPSETRKFLKDLYASMPFPASLGVRIAFWTVGVSPFFKRQRFMGFDRLTFPERVQILNEFSSSESYFIRQMIIILKLNGSLSQTATLRFHAFLEANKS